MGGAEALDTMGYECERREGSGDVSGGDGSERFKPFPQRSCPSSTSIGTVGL